MEELSETVRENVSKNNFVHNFVSSLLGPGPQTLPGRLDLAWRRQEGHGRDLLIVKARNSYIV